MNKLKFVAFKYFKLSLICLFDIFIFGNNSEFQFKYVFPIISKSFLSFIIFRKKSKNILNLFISLKLTDDISFFSLIYF